MRGSSSFPTSSASPQSVPLQALQLEKAGKAEGSDWHPSPWVPERLAMIVGQNHQHNIFIFSVSFSPALSNSLLFNIKFLRIFAYVPSKSSSMKHFPSSSPLVVVLLKESQALDFVERVARENKSSKAVVAVELTGKLHWESVRWIGLL